MTTYTIKDPDSGKSITLTGDGEPPTEAEIEAAFAEARRTVPFIQTPSASVGGAQGPSKAGMALYSATDAAARIAEPAMTFASSMIAEPVAGIAGLARGATNLFTEAMGGKAPTSAAQTVGGIQDAMTYQPRTEAGRESLQGIAELVSPVTELQQKIEQGAGDIAYEATDSPLAGAAGVTAPTALAELATLGAGRVLRRARNLEEKPLITPEGQPTPELSIVLQRAGLNFDELPPGAVNALRTFTTARRPEDVLRAAQFEEAGVTPLRSNVTQNFPESAQEQRLATLTDKRGDAMRRRMLEQSQEFKASAEGQAELAGDAAEAGESVKTVLNNRQKSLNKQKRKLYQEYAETNEGVASMPVDAKPLREAQLSDAELDDLATTAGEGVIERLDNLLIKYGINSGADDVARYMKGTTRGRPNALTPLTIGNFESFRKSINALNRSDTTGALKVATAPIVRALDGELDLIQEALTTGGVNTQVIDALRKARGLHAQVKAEFNPKALTGRLVEFKKNSNIPTIENSQAAKKTLTATPEDLDRVVSSLLRSGDAGTKAVGNLQARVVLDALEHATKAGSRKIDGEKVAEGQMFDDYLSKKVGEDKLDILFANNPDGRKALNNLREVAKNMSAAADAKPKGSAPVILDILRLVGRAPIVGHGFDLLQIPATAAGNAMMDSRRVTKAIEGNAPRKQSAASDFKANWPTLAGVLAIGAARDDDSSESP